MPPCRPAASRRDTDPLLKPFHCWPTGWRSVADACLRIGCTLSRREHVFLTRIVSSQGRPDADQLAWLLDIAEALLIAAGDA